PRAPARPARRCSCRPAAPAPTWLTASPGAADRAAACTGCGGYLKWLEPPGATPFELLAVEDLASATVDALAAGRGFGRPPLPDLGGPQRLPCEALEPDPAAPAPGEEREEAAPGGGAARERGS
ncbi:MAG: hypothetical protein OXG35_13815, partial [Acidobacteria bacterium]|nr:hypothetical protein [Acidobacteriota bacterium]